ncbi:MAG: tyrosine-type recombinase/integrase [Flavobacteriaceae bacterium]
MPKKVKFNLKNPSKKDGATLILLKMHLGEKTPMTISTEEKISAKKWDKKKQRVKGYSGDAKKINRWLDDLEEIADNIYKNLRRNGIHPTNTEIKNRLKLKLGYPSNNSLFEFIKKMDKQYKEKGRAQKSFISTLNILKQYDNQLNFENITIDFYHKFVAYLYKNEYATNYIGVMIKNIKLFMRESLEHKPPLHGNLDFQRSDFKRPSAPTFKISLTPNQIQKIYKCKELNENLQKWRDVFVCACDTGLRYQSWGDISLKNVEYHNQKPILIVITHKTNEKVAIPLTNRVITILKKHNGTFGKIISNQKINATLKEIGKAAGLDHQAENIVQRKNKDIQTVPFYSLITTHTARRSFITNLKRAGVQDADIMKMTGHTQHKTLSVYDKENIVENAVKIANLNTINTFIKIAK